ncbi:hypothetical protein GGR58DRAFT_507868 [Xylaria digitata]|nr:hypothetical protein GGR58DRAFT_507868 [Xylaria digitata]
MEDNSWIALLNILKRNIEKCRKIQREINAVKFTEDVDWAAAGIPNTQLRVAQESRGSVDHGKKVVRDQFQLQKTFSSIDELEAYECYSIVQYLHRLARALAEITSSLCGYHVRLNKEYREEKDKCKRRFLTYSRARSQGLYPGIAMGERSPLCIVTSIDDSDLIDIIDGPDYINSMNITWDDYVAWYNMHMDDVQNW